MTSVFKGHDVKIYRQSYEVNRIKFNVDMLTGSKFVEAKFAFLQLRKM